MDPSHKLSELYSLRDELYVLTHEINHEIDEKRFMADDLNKKLFKTLGAIEFLEQDGVVFPEE
jgi:hypothetical protein